MSAISKQSEIRFKVGLSGSECPSGYQVAGHRILKINYVTPNHHDLHLGCHT
jgi:hypothetical protein